MFLPHGVNVHYAAAIKAAGVKTPVVTLGGITTPELAEQILAEGKADVIAMARASIADPHFPDKARHGHPEDIVPCLRCLDCLTGLHAGNQLSCADNAAPPRRPGSTACPPPQGQAKGTGGRRRPRRHDGRSHRRQTGP